MMLKNFKEEKVNPESTSHFTLRHTSDFCTNHVSQIAKLGEKSECLFLESGSGHARISRNNYNKTIRGPDSELGET